MEINEEDKIINNKINSLKKDEKEIQISEILTKNQKMKMGKI